MTNCFARLEDADEGKIGWGGHEMDASVTPSSSEAVMRARFIGVVYCAYYLILRSLTFRRTYSWLRGWPAGSVRIRGASSLLVVEDGSGGQGKGTPDKLSGASANGGHRWAHTMNLESSLADEPTGNLDERTGGQVMDLLLDACLEQRTGLVLVTHNPKLGSGRRRSTLPPKGKAYQGFR